MRRIASLLSLAALVVAGACSDRTTSPIVSPDGPRLTVEGPGQVACTQLTEAQIHALIDAVYMNGSPDEQSALAKWDNITKQRAAGDREDLIKAKIVDLVDFTLEKSAQGKLDADEAELAVMLNALFCYGGMADDYYYGGGGGQFIYPLDSRQTIVAEDGRAAITFEFDPVDRPTLVTISLATDTLDTNLDKYPRVYEFSKYPADAVLKSSAITEVCAEAPETVFPNLVLGHNSSVDGFEILEKPAAYTPVLTQCETSAPTGFASSLGSRLLQMLLPRKLHAAALFGGGGIAGSVDNLSPIGPIDPRVKIVKSSVLPAHKPIGTAISPAAKVTLTSYSFNKPIANVPVAFTTASGSVSTSPVNTGTDGSAMSMWTLGVVPGTVTLRSTPAAGGGAAPGVVFIGQERTPDSGEFDSFEEFSIEATAASRVALTDGPTLKDAGASLAAGLMPSVRAVTVDAYGDTVAAFSGSLTASLTQGAGLTPTSRTFNAPSTTSVSVNNGVATFAALRIHTAGSDYRISIGGTDLTAGATGLFVVTPAAGIIARAEPFIPDTVTAGTQTARVKVVDEYNNALAGSTVFWQAFGSTVASTSTVGSDGLSSVTWTLQDGPNTALAALDNPASSATGRSIDFNTFYKVKSTALLTCSVNQNRADLAPYGFRLGTWPKINGTFARLASVKLFFSVTGEASSPKVNTLRLIITRRTATAIVKIDTVFSDVLLKGNASQDAPGVFLFPANYSTTTDQTLELKIERVDLATQGTLRFNTGSCSGNNRLTPYRFDGAKGVTSVAYQLYGR